jgi:hypothetical protein
MPRPYRPSCRRGKQSLTKQPRSSPNPGRNGARAQGVGARRRRSLWVRRGLSITAGRVVAPIGSGPPRLDLSGSRGHEVSTVGCSSGVMGRKRMRQSPVPRRINGRRPVRGLMSRFATRCRNAAFWPKVTKPPDLVTSENHHLPAETAGFEPARECYPPNRLAGGCFRPLSHVSGNDSTEGLNR